MKNNTKAKSEWQTGRQNQNHRQSQNDKSGRQKSEWQTSRQNQNDIQKVRITERDRQNQNDWLKKSEWQASRQSKTIIIKKVLTNQRHKELFLKTSIMYNNSECFILLQTQGCYCPRNVSIAFTMKQHSTISWLCPYECWNLKWRKKKKKT